MASLVLKLPVSLDGWVAPADGSSDWITAGRCGDGARWVLDTVSHAAPTSSGGDPGDVGRFLARGPRLVRRADERDPQGRVL